METPRESLEIDSSTLHFSKAERISETDAIIETATECAQPAQRIRIKAAFLCLENKASGYEFAHSKLFTVHFYIIVINYKLFYDLLIIYYGYININNNCYNIIHLI